jgi:hypothetical protein
VAAAWRPASTSIAGSGRHDQRVEQGRQLHGEHARPAAHVDEGARPVQPDGGAHDVRQLGRVGRATRR